MRKTRLLLFAILLSHSIVAFSQWIDISQKRVFYLNSVYTISGEKLFHKDNCKLLIGKGKLGMTLEYAQQKGYTPCLECFPDVTPIKYEWTFSLEKPTPSNNLFYSDGFIDIAFLINKTQIGFAIQNKTESGIKLNWDEISFISPTGTASRVIHSGIRLIDKNNPQAPTVIPPNSKISDIVIPSENIKYEGGWKEGRLFEGDYITFNGKEFSIYFPLEIKGVKKEYSFKFKTRVTKVTSENK